MTSLPLISKSVPLVHALRYSHLGVAVSSVSSSLDFYSKIGFKLQSSVDEPVVLLKNRGGLQLHIFHSDLGIEDDKNLLMDYPTSKYPGHTHASFSVPNVASARTYLESQQIVVSGERKFGDKLRAVFVRDIDKTTYEFERNYEDPVDVEVTSDDIGYPQSIDHIGIRVSAPELHWQWYAENLGFVRNVMKYEANADMLKNGPPWIARTESGIDINFIINANVTPAENILLANGAVRPGIVYAAYTVRDVTAAETALRTKGIEVVRDADLGSSTALRCLAGKILPSAQSIFLQDPDHNVLRLIESDE